MSFGLSKAAHIFQRFMDEILKDVDFCFAYLDDIIVFSDPPEEHDKHLLPLFTQLRTYGILLNPYKRVFGVPEISFLGYEISSHGSQPLPERIADLQTCSPPKKVSQHPRVLGILTSTYDSSPTLHQFKLISTKFFTAPESRVFILFPGLRHSTRLSTSVNEASLKPLYWHTQIRLLHSP
jgi:hypothetical protein